MYRARHDGRGFSFKSFGVLGLRGSLSGTELQPPIELGCSEGVKLILVAIPPQFAALACSDILEIVGHV